MTDYCKRMPIDRDPRYADALLWSKSVPMLENAEADILGFLDWYLISTLQMGLFADIRSSCYPKTLGIGQDKSRLVYSPITRVLLINPRKFEYHAASQDLYPKPIPGQISFTSALHLALQGLVEEKKVGQFTTWSSSKR